MKGHAGPERLGAFSDGVIAIIITIMVLELKVPHAASWPALRAEWPTFLAYAVSYVFVALLWVNHHHLVHYTEKATPRTLWTNLLLLFFTSLIPFVTEWVADTRLAAFPTAMYALACTLTCAGFLLFEYSVAAQLDLVADAQLGRVRRRANLRNWTTLGLYAVGVPVAFWHPWVTLALTGVNAVLYVAP